MQLEDTKGPEVGSPTEQFACQKEQVATSVPKLIIVYPSPAVGSIFAAKDWPVCMTTGAIRGEESEIGQGVMLIDLGWASTWPNHTLSGEYRPEAHAAILGLHTTQATFPAATIFMSNDNGPHADHIPHIPRVLHVPFVSLSEILDPQLCRE